jgi:hypothetical protein
MEKKDLSNLFVTNEGHLCRFEYLRFEINEEEFYETVMQAKDLSENTQIFEVDINCIGVMDYVENHPLFPRIVWDSNDILFGFNPRFIDDKLGW